MTKYPPILFLALMTGGCTHTVRTSSVQMTRHPDTQPISAMKRQIANAADAGEGDTIARTLRQRMAADPSNLKIRMELARHYEESGIPELAAEHYRLASQLAPDSPEAAVGHARMLRRLDLSAQALTTLAKFQSDHHHVSPEVLNWLGILQDEAGDFAKAEASYRAALILNPKSDAVHNNLGYNLLLQNRMSQAADEFRTALAIAPQSQIARNNLGVALASQPREAVLHMQSVSDPATAHSNLAAVLIEQGAYKQAREELRIALGYRKDHPAALSNLLLLSQLDGQPLAVPASASSSHWKRFSGGMKKIFLGTDGRVHEQENVKTASK
ncbi:MAG: tetratricopeptide repeat protein [Bryobacteraceae bacterium]